MWDATLLAEGRMILLTMHCRLLGGLFGHFAPVLAPALLMQVVRLSCCRYPDEDR